MADEGHSRATAMLAGAHRGEVSIEAAEAAAARLREPTKNTHGRYAFGTNAIAKSLLARTLPAAGRRGRGRGRSNDQYLWMRLGEVA
jgi:hypothetical protein